MPTLDRITVSGFKSIGQMELDLRPINVLIGANGAGRSNFIGVFALLQRVIEGRLQLYVAQAGGADSLLHFGQKQTQSLQLGLRFGPNDTFYRASLVPSANDALIFAEEEWGHESDIGSQATSSPVGAEGRHESVLLERWDQSRVVPESQSQSQEQALKLFEQLNTPRKQVRALLRGARVYHFHDTSSAAGVKQTQDIGDNEVLRTDAANLAAFLFLLREKHPDSYRRIVATVRLAAPFFEDFRLRPSPFNEQKILLEWSERSSESYFNAHALSDGTLRFICLATLLLQPTPPPLIIIDEPELGLHPYAIQLLADLVSSASEKSQVILSTQSVTLVNQFAPEDLIVVDRREGESLFRRLTPEETQSWLDSYSLGELWEKNVIGGRPG